MKQQSMRSCDLNLIELWRNNMLDIIILFAFISIVLAPCMLALHITATDGPLPQTGR